jgi:hypothetical protein
MCVTNWHFVAEVCALQALQNHLQGVLVGETDWDKKRQRATQKSRV